ncbi:hypothetical protein CFC21_071512 [Triticum aestivum]|uniref:Uncharacterized protein n=3 Tax=Triticinae TaxID=1648030 RepID=A0A3B6QDU1_WHEAT|nr:hypothetical protein CFC21_071512 [Triticum aestivum]
MGKKAAAVICGTASVLGLLAAILGFAGEGTKSQSFVGFDGVRCVYRSTAARGCGVAGALFLLAAQVLLAAATGCSGCCRPETRKIPSETKRVFAVAMYILSWILMFIAAALFFIGAMWNTAGKRKPAEETSTAEDCYVLQTGVFATASALSLIVVSFGIGSYFLLGASAPPREQQPEIALGQPPPYFQAQPQPHGGYPAGTTWQTRV